MSTILVVLYNNISNSNFILNSQKLEMIKYSWQETGDKVYAFQQWNIIGNKCKSEMLYGNIILSCLKQKNIHDHLQEVQGQSN